MTGEVSVFETSEDDTASKEFLRKGYVIAEAENRAGLDALKRLAAETTRQHLNIDAGPEDDDALLNAVHQYVGVEGLNGLRLSVIGALRSQVWFRPTYYSLAANLIKEIVGNELSMQRGVGLSVQLPNDESSLLPIHTDVWDGDSPFEVVLWVPLVDVQATKSMFITSLENDRPHQANMSDFQDKSSEALFQSVKKDVEFVKIPYGSVLLFSQTLMHGNRVNKEPETRWSMNCRFKSAMSPYADKKLGEFFEPISLRPATRVGLSYELPEGFDE